MAKSSKTSEAGAAKRMSKTSSGSSAPDETRTSNPAMATASSGAKSSAAKPAQAKPASKSSGKAGGGLAQPVQPSKELAAVVGEAPLPRSEIVKKIWDYIKAHDLQNPKNKREIMANDTLLPIFGKPSVTMFELNGHIARHVK